MKATVFLLTMLLLLLPILGAAGTELQTTEPKPDDQQQSTGCKIGLGLSAGTGVVSLMLMGIPGTQTVSVALRIASSLLIMSTAIFC
ncbi:MAG: hypothetical protein HY645_11380 [Acidobacteria bacterium]|nr:hypothetical protein [Acidobacteriota bacterium]